MMKFTAGGKDGRTLIVIGLSAGNLERLKEGKPIHLCLEELNLPWKADLMIMYGETTRKIRGVVHSMVSLDP